MCSPTTRSEHKEGGAALAAHIDDFRFFSTVAQSTSLTAAGRVLGVSVSVVSRRLTEIERRLGVALVTRTPRELLLTDEGRRLADGAQRLTEDAEELENSIRSSRKHLQGSLVVRGTLGFGRAHLAPVVAQFQDEYPNISVFLELSSEPVDLSSPQFDLLVSVGEPKDSTLIYRRLLHNRRIVCASPAYIEEHGAPTTLADLGRHDCILLSEHDPGFNRWRFVDGDRMQTVGVSGHLRSNDGDVVTGWCLNGHGIMMRSMWNVEKHLQSGELIQLLPHVPTATADVYMARPRTQYQAARTELLVEHLLDEIPKRVSDD